jgi:hypothetical protein
MIPGYITRDHVLAAIARIDKEGVPANRQRTNFEIRYQGREYPPKLLISIAHKEAKGIPLDPILFEGGMRAMASSNGLGLWFGGGEAPFCPQ